MQTPLATLTSNGLSTASAMRKLNVLAALAMAPLQSAANLALLYQVSLRTMRSDLLWLEERGLIASYLPSSCGRRNKYLFEVSSDGLDHLCKLQHSNSLTANTAVPLATLVTRRTMRRQYRDQLLRLIPRLPHYIQLQELGDWLAMTWREQFSLGTRSVEEEILKVPAHDSFRDDQQRSSASKPSWRWLRDVSLGFDYHGRQTTCTIDALAIATQDFDGSVRLPYHPMSPLCWGQQINFAPREIPQQHATALLWVYLDDGVSPPQVLRSRISKLLKYRHELGISPDDFPAMLVRAGSHLRAWQWTQAVQQSAERLGMEPLYGTLLFPGEADPQGSARTGKMADLTTTGVRTAVWPLIQNGLAVSPEPRMLPARDLRWLPLVTWPDDQEGRTYLASSLYVPSKSNVVQAILESLKRPIRALQLPFISPHVTSSKVIDLVTSFSLGSYSPRIAALSSDLATG